MSTYVCPMHSDVHTAQAGKCPHCGMALVPEQARFKLVRHMLGNPLHIAVMIAVMIAAMAIAMMVMR